MKENENLNFKRIFDYVDKQTVDVLQKSQRMLSESLTKSREDIDNVILKLGNSIQGGLQEVQKQFEQELNHMESKRENDFDLMSGKLIMKNE